VQNAVERTEICIDRCYFTRFFSDLSSTVFITSFFVHFPDFPETDSPAIPQPTSKVWAQQPRAQARLEAKEEEGNMKKVKLLVAVLSVALISGAVNTVNANGCATTSRRIGVPVVLDRGVPVFLDRGAPVVMDRCR
jgi:hypothetical protein